MRCLAQEFAGVSIENSFLRGGSVAPHQHAPRGVRMAHGDIAQPPVAGFPRGEKDNPHIHHDVDEQRIVGYKRPQVLAFFLEALGQSPAGLDQHLA